MPRPAQDRIRRAAPHRALVIARACSFNEHSLPSPGICPTRPLFVPHAALNRFVFDANILHTN
jgi:hypothetical protein